MSERMADMKLGFSKAVDKTKVASSAAADATARATKSTKLKADCALLERKIKGIKNDVGTDLYEAMAADDQARVQSLFTTARNKISSIESEVRGTARACSAPTRALLPSSTTARLIEVDDGDFDGAPAVQIFAKKSEIEMLKTSEKERRASQGGGDSGFGAASSFGARGGRTRLVDEPSSTAPPSHPPAAVGPPSSPPPALGAAQQQAPPAAAPPTPTPPAGVGLAAGRPRAADGTLLPPGWKCTQSAEGKPYYYHEASGEVSWSVPKADAADLVDIA